MQGNVLKVENVSFSYKKDLVLENVNLKINKGDYVAIVGPNGSAKSTLLKLMVGILKPNKGKIKLFDKDIKKFKDWDKIGYLSQKVRDFNSRFPATVEEIVGANLYSEMGFLKFLTKKHKNKIKNTLKIVDMEDYSQKLIGNLSGGQQQRVFIARVLINNPEIIFMDEPLVGVDVTSQQKFYKLMEKLNKQFGITLVMVSHDVGIVSTKVNRIACLGKKQLYIHNSNNFDKNVCVNELFGENMKIVEHKHK